MKYYLNLLIVSLVLILVGCGGEVSKISGLKMLEGGKTFAVPTGTAADQFVKQRFPDAKIIYLNSVLDCALAVKGGKADAAIYDEPVLKNIAGKNEGLTVLSELLVGDQYGFAVQLENKALKDAVDQVLVELKSKGTYDDMMKRWFPAKGSPAPMPDFESIASEEPFRFGTAAVTEPMSYFDGNQKIVGFDVEFAQYVAKKLKKRLEIVDMEFGALLPSLISGKVDMIGAGISITAERAKKVLFSNCYYPSGIAALVRDGGKEGKTTEKTLLRGVEDIKDKKIGVLLGSIHDRYATSNFPGAQILQYQNVNDMLNSLNSGKIDVAIYDQLSLKDVFKSNPNLGIVAKDITASLIGSGFNKGSSQLRDQFNAFLKELKSNGTYDDMVDRWINKDSNELPVITNSNANGQLRTGIVGDMGRPFAFMQNGQLTGFDIELAKRFAASLGKEFVPVDMPFGSLIASISTNKIDLIVASMSITEERKKQIDFSDPYFESGVSVVADKKDIAQTGSVNLAKLDDIADKRVGVFVGTVHDAFVATKYPKAQLFRLSGSATMITSLTSDKIDVAFLDFVTANLLMKKNPTIGLLSKDVLTMPLGVGFNKNNRALREKFNTFLQSSKQDGSYDNMHKRWFADDPEKAVMPKFSNPATGKKLVVGVSVDDLPYVAFMNGDYVGFDIELISKFANHEKLEIEFVKMEFASLIAALSSGKVDMISDGIAITEERSKAIDFSDSYAEFRTAVIALKSKLAGSDIQSAPTAKVSFFSKVSDSFYNNIILEKRYLLIWEGLKVTMFISIFAALFGTLMGGLICFMRMSKRKILVASAKTYINLLRGTPVLVLLMIIYYVVFASVNINPVAVAVFAFGLNFAAYVSEMFRTSIESLDKGQKEAAIAGGFTKIQTFIYIILPQALRRVLPVYEGEFISLIKMTSIVGYIAVQDLTKASDIIRSRTFDAFFPLIMVAVLYLLIAWLLTGLLSYVEISSDPRRKNLKREVEVKG